MVTSCRYNSIGGTGQEKYLRVRDVLVQLALDVRTGCGCPGGVGCATEP